MVDDDGLTIVMDVVGLGFILLGIYQLIVNSVVCLLDEGGS